MRSAYGKIPKDILRDLSLLRILSGVCVMTHHGKEKHIALLS